MPQCLVRLAKQRNHLAFHSLLSFFFFFAVDLFGWLPSFASVLSMVVLIDIAMFIFKYIRTVNTVIHYLDGHYLDPEIIWTDVEYDIVTGQLFFSFLCFAELTSLFLSQPPKEVVVDSFPCLKLCASAILRGRIWKFIDQATVFFQQRGVRACGVVAFGVLGTFVIALFVIGVYLLASVCGALLTIQVSVLFLFALADFLVFFLGHGRCRRDQFDGGAGRRGAGLGQRARDRERQGDQPRDASVVRGHLQQRAARVGRYHQRVQSRTGSEQQQLSFRQLSFCRPANWVFSIKSFVGFRPNCTAANRAHLSSKSLPRLMYTEHNATRCLLTECCRRLRRVPTCCPLYLECTLTLIELNCWTKFDCKKMVFHLFQPVFHSQHS